MRVKVYFTSLIFIVLFSTSIFGQINQNRPTKELRQDLKYYQNVIKAKNWWFFITADVGMEGRTSYSTILLPRKEGIKAYINNLHKRGIWNHNYIHHMVDIAHNYSNKIKFYIKRDTIPELQRAIASRSRMHINTINANSYDSQPSYNYTPKTCRSFSKRDYWTGSKNDRVRWHCTYWRSSRRLLNETEYVEKKKHGPSIIYFNDGKINASYNYWNGYRDGVGKVWINHKNSYYLITKTIYRRGKKVKVTQWYSNGNVEKVANYYPNGKPHITYNYRKNGQLAYCTKWNTKGQIIDCKTGRLVHY